MKIVVLNWNDVVPDLSKYFEIIEGEDFLGADAIIAAHDTNPTQAAQAKTAMEYGIPVFTLQHGRFSASDYLYNNKSPAGDYFLAWGDTDAKMAIEGGWKKEQVLNVGAVPFADWVKPRPDGKTVVFAPAHVEALPSLNAMNDNEALNVWNILRDMKGINPVAKLLKGEHPEELFHGNKFITSRSESGHIKKIYKQLLKKTSCVVSQAEGTFELLAYSMDIPVIRFNNIYHGPDRFHTAATVIDNIDELEETVRRVLKNPSEKRKERKAVTEADGGATPSNVLKNIVGTIRQKVTGKRLRSSKKNKCEVITYYLKEVNKDSYYRLIMPLDKIAEHDENIAIKKVHKSDTSAKIAHGLITDMIALPPTGQPRLVDMVYRLKELDKKIVLDFNENIFNISPFSPKYHRYGQENVKVGDTILWENSSNIDLFSNQVYVENIMIALELADLVTVSTQALADIYSEYNKNVVVLPTCIDVNTWKELPLKKDSTIRIGWCGGTESINDVKIIAKAMKVIMEQHKNVIFVLLGARFTDTFRELPQDRIEHHLPVGFEAMPYKIAALNLDIGLIPHKDTEHSKYDTPTKWLEFASSGISSVSSFIYPYTEISDGEAGVFIEDNQEDGWISGINELVEDPVLRSKIAGEARRFTEKHYDINVHYKKWVNEYQGLYN